MGYTLSKSFSVYDSDHASDNLYDIEKDIIAKLRKIEKKESNEYNTDGKVDVALILQHLAWDNCSSIAEYAEEFIKRFEKYIEKESNRTTWDSEENKLEHLTAYRRVLKNIEKKIKE